MPYDKPVSYSGMSLWKQCPRRWHDAYVLGNREPSGPAAERGTRLHNALENFFNGAPYPSSDKCLAPWQKFMAELAERLPVAEGEVAVDSTWTPTTFDDPKAYFRGKKDLHIVDGSKLILYDWKSGGIYPEHHYQGEAYVALSPGYDEYEVHFAYLDQPLLVHSTAFTVDDRDEIVAELTEQIEVIRTATEYPATPSRKCAWCRLSWRRGGSCQKAW